MKKFLKTLWNVIWPFLVYYAATLVVTFGMYIIYTGRQLLSGKGFDVEEGQSLEQLKLNCHEEQVNCHT